MPGFEEQEYEPGEFVIHQGEPGDARYVARTGEVEVTAATENEAHPVWTVEAGGYVGEAALLAREQDDPEPAMDLLLAAGDWHRLGRLLDERAEAVGKA